MGLFDRFRKNKLQDRHSMPGTNDTIPYVDMYSSIFDKNGIYIEREDHTHIDLRPKLDSAGHQMYKQIYCAKQNKMINLGIWEIDYKIARYMDAQSLDPDIREIYLSENITPEWFSRDDMFRDKDTTGRTLQNFLVNELLSRERLEDVIENREGYIGGVIQDEYGRYRKHKDSSFIKELRLERETGVPSGMRHKNDVIRVEFGRQTDISKEK